MTQVAGYFQNYDESDRPSQVNGMDVAHYQLDYPHSFASAYDAGARFVVFKAGGMVGGYGGGTGYFQARYIRCWANGSYTNVSSLFTLLEVYDTSLSEIAHGKTVTGSYGANAQYGSPSTSYSIFTDGSTSTWIGADNQQWVKVDLGTTCNCIRVVLWHYPDRKFKENKVEYSTDGTTWYTLFDSDLSGEYTEINHPWYGNFIGTDIIKGTTGQYSKDSTFTAANVASARAAGLKVGAYWFKNPNYCFGGSFLNSSAEASSEASVFWQYITSAFGLSDWPDTFVWLDWENNDGNTIYPAADNDGSYSFIKTFCDTIKVLSNGRQCGVYTAWYVLDGQTAVTANTLVHSVDGGLGSVCPLWYSQIVDLPYGSAYPNRAGWNQGQFGGWTSWTLWQYTFENLASDYGIQSYAGAPLDGDICEGDIVNIMQPTPVSALAGVGGSDFINLTWTTGESDVRGYMYYASTVATATVTTGLEAVTIPGLAANTSYAITMQSYDLWEISDSTSLDVETTSVMVGAWHALPCFKL